MRRAIFLAVTSFLVLTSQPSPATHPPQHLGNLASSAPAARISATPSGSGYFTMDVAGGVFTHGDARFFGSVPGLRQQGVSIGQANVIDLSTTGDGQGYWILDDVGGMFAFGNADFFGSVPGLRNAGVAVGPGRVLDLDPTSSNAGYYLLDEHGGVFSFGDAVFYGSIPELRNQGIAIGPAQAIALVAWPGGGGYWMLDSAGGLFTFGNAPFFGSLPQRGVAARAIAMAATPDGQGYWIATDDGGMHAFGSAAFFGSAAGRTGNARAVGFAASPHGTGYWILLETRHVIVYPGGAGEIVPPVSFGDGTRRVGVDIPAGTYRTRADTSGCYWERLRGFNGELSDVIANEFTNFHDVVTIAASDAGFRSSNCGSWTNDLSAMTPSTTASFGPGTFIAGTDIAPGTWSAPGGSGCYWERLRDFRGEGSSIIANDFGSTSPLVTIQSSDVGFSSSNCGTWSRV